ncbi:MAG: hypothetical protein O4861_14030 [Trichodesmium sp. St16_bin4-tuft]|nr:hypothetical protein [Trichodesmium sp. ALOHA_ZT_67]MDE5099383.1 hypothetical protein [Trichodesmium sp. St16_bin4-tuft]MDE5104711.1 hypothetical protein [Trichodesmium sp. St19_bin2]MDT9340836.1 hypothetical protein [Trichodesmium erythraeum 21-75]
MLHRLRFLEIAEYVFIFASAVGIFVNYFWQKPIVYPLGLVLISLLINLLNRRNLGAQIKAIKFETTGKIDKYQDSISEIISELQNNIKSLKSTTEVLEIHQVEEKIQPLLETLKTLSNRLDIQEKTIKLLQAELNLFSQQFNQRPELKQINDLASVIVDLQQFINKLPEWSSLREQSFQKLEEKVNQALLKLEKNIAAEKRKTDN